MRLSINVTPSELETLIRLVNGERDNLVAGREKFDAMPSDNMESAERAAIDLYLTHQIVDVIDLENTLKEARALSVA